MYPPKFVTPEGEEILLGPYNHQQAPTEPCDNCGTHITVGQRVTIIQEFLQGVTRSGRLVTVPAPDYPEPSKVHSDCSAEFAHDQITKEPCGKEEEDDENVCEFCDVEIPDGYKACAGCAHKLGLPGYGSVITSQLVIPVDQDDLEDQREQLESLLETQRSLVARLREQYKQETMMSEQLLHGFNEMHSALQRIVYVINSGHIPPSPSDIIKPV